MKEWEWKPWELTMIGFAIVTIILAIIGYYVKAVEPYSTLATYILVTMNAVMLVLKLKEIKEKK